MKALIISSVLLFSFSSFAYEKLVFDGTQRDFGPGIGNLYSNLYVNQTTGEAGVKVTFKRMSDDFSRSYVKNFPVENMFLEGDKLMININGEMIECGTMGESRVLRIPTLTISGNCSTRLETKYVGRFLRPKTLVKAFLNVKTSN